MKEDKALIIARKCLVDEKKIGKPKKRQVELIKNDIRKRKLEEVDPPNRCTWQKAVETSRPLLAQTNTESLQLKRQMEDEMMNLQPLFYFDL